MGNARAQSIQAFLSALFAGSAAQGLVTTWTLPSKRSLHLPLSQLDQISKDLLEHDAQAHDCYVGCGLRREGLDVVQRGRARDVVAIPGFWAEFDLQSESPVTSKKLLPDEDAVAQVLEVFPCFPTTLVHSGHGIHAWWLFEAGPVAVDDANRSTLKSALRTLNQMFLRRAKELGGYEVDQVGNIDRVLRIPGTTNWKQPKTPKPVHVISESKRFELKALLATLGATLDALGGALSTGQEAGSALGGLDTAPEPQPVEDAGEAIKKVLKNLKKLKDATNRPLAKKIFDGEALAGEGGRDNALQVAASIIAFLEPDLDPEKLVQVLLPSLDEMKAQAENPENPPPDVDDAIDKLRRAQEDARIQRQELKLQAERFNEKIAARVRKTLNPESAGPPPGFSSVPVPVPVPAPEPAPAPAPEPAPVLMPVAIHGVDDGGEVISEALSPIPAGALLEIPFPTSMLQIQLPPAPLVPIPNGVQEHKQEPGLDPDPADPDDDPVPEPPEVLEEPVKPFYTDEELASWCGKHGCGSDADEFRRRQIIQKNKRFWVMVNGKYRAPVFDNELMTKLRDYLVPLQFNFTKPGAKGSPIPKTQQEILNDLATVPLKVISDLTLAESYYDANSETFYEASTKLRPITPKFNPEVHKWLILLGGADWETLLDWIASITFLDQETCAIYLEGSKGAGKTLLANGLARLWATRVTELSKIVGNWNTDLAQCPLIFADEQLPTKWDGQQTLSELRDLVASRGRTLTRKHVDNVELRGAVRFMLSANNSRMLSLGDDDLDANDIYAIAERFYHIPVSKAPTDYLVSINSSGTSSSGTKDWVNGDVIAAHALWLRDNRPVQRGPRFIIAGQADKLARRLVVNHKIGGSILEFITRFLTAQAAGSTATADQLVLSGNGELLVSTEILATHWKLFVLSDPTQPATTKIGRALQNLSLDERWVTDKNNQRKLYRLVDPGFVYAWCEETGVGDPDAIAHKINQEV